MSLNFIFGKITIQYTGIHICVETQVHIGPTVHQILILILMRCGQMIKCKGWMNENNKRGREWDAWCLQVQVWGSFAMYE